MASLRTMMNVDDEHRVQLLNGMDSVKTVMKAEDERHVQVQKKKDTMKIMAVGNEHPAHSKNEKDSRRTEAKRLPYMLTKGTVGGPASRESHLKMRGPRKNCIATSKATAEKEKKVPMNKERVALTLPTSTKAVRAEAVYPSNTYHRPGESRMKTRHQKLDYSKVQAKVNTWR
jgi:hypothetical protein